MTSPLNRIALQAAYGASQLPRLAWYLGHGVAMRQLARAAQAQRVGTTARISAGSKRPAAAGAQPAPDRGRLFADMAKLLQRDMANVADGIYPVPVDNDGSWSTLLDRSRLFFTDLPSIHRRREGGLHSEVLREATVGKRPRYYLQNFHFQSGGWMTDDSARRYDTQVEVMFSGTANAMRRQALPALHEVFAGRDARGLRLLDVGCGTGRFLDSVKQAWPRMPVLGLDLSEAYVREGRRHLARWPHARMMVANADSIPVADASQDAVTSIFLFHELPPAIRRAVFREFARVLKVGGRLVLVDSVQIGDEPGYDGMLETFPKNFHEPFFSSYIREDFGQLAEEVGLVRGRDVRAFVSKVMVFDKP